MICNQYLRANSKTRLPDKFIERTALGRHAQVLLKLTPYDLAKPWLILNHEKVVWRFR
jgi:hypothetical protein